MQYADYAEWQYEVLQSADAETLLAQRQSHDYSDVQSLRLLWRAGNAAGRSFDPQWAGVTLAQETFIAFQGLAGKLKSSIEDLWMACWEVFLWRIGGTGEDLLLSAALNARKYEPLARAIGSLTVTVPYRCLLSQEMEIEQVVRQVESTRMRIEESLEYFSWDCVAGTPRHQNLLYAPIAFEFSLVSGTHSANEVIFSPGRIDIHAELFDLRLVVSQTENGVELEFHYNAQRLTQDYVRHLLRSFCALVESLVRAPGEKIGALHILGDADTERVLRTFCTDRSRHVILVVICRG